MNLLRLTIPSFLCGLLAACSSVMPIREANFGDVVGVATDADKRLVTQRTRSAVNGTGKVVCTEPSPDIAKAFSEALSASGGNGEVTAEAQFQHAEAIAQLGKRYATVQLLRDILFRDCEDYANGAISDVVYAYRAAHFDDMVVTLLGVEMVSGENASTSGQVTSPSLTLNNNGSGSATVQSPTTSSDANTKKDDSTDTGGGKDATKSGTKEGSTSTDKSTSTDGEQDSKNHTATVIAASQAVEASDKAVQQAAKSVKALSTIKSPVQEDKDAVDALSTLDKSVSSTSGDADKALKAIIKADAKPSDDASSAVKTAGTSIGKLKSGAGSAAASKSKNKDISDAGADEDTAITKLASTAKSLAAATVTEGVPKPSPTPGTPAGLPNYRTITDAQAKAIEQMQWNFLTHDAGDPLIYVCASVLRALPIDTSGEPVLRQLDALQRYCERGFPNQAHGDSVSGEGSNSSTEPTGMGRAVEQSYQLKSKVR